MNDVEWSRQGASGAYEARARGALCLALAFADVLRQERPGLRVLTLAETQGAINRAELADACKRMYNDYRDSTIVWEGRQEMRHSHDTMTEEPIMQRIVLERTAPDQISGLP